MPAMYVDPSGLDIIVLYDSRTDPGQDGSSLNHGAVLIGSDETGWHYYSFGAGTNEFYAGDNLEHKAYRTLERASRDPEISRYNEFITYETTSEQEGSAKVEAESWNGTVFSLGKNNCWRFVYCVMRAGGQKYKPIIAAFVYTKPIFSILGWQVYVAAPTMHFPSLPINRNQPGVISSGSWAAVLNDARKR